MERMDIASLADARPSLHTELDWRNVTELWRLNDVPVGPDAKDVGEETWILLAKSAIYDYIILSTAGTENTPDKYSVWVHNRAALDAGRQEQELPKGYVLIDKRRLGRKRRELTTEEVEQIRARHEAGDGINKIAKALHMGTRTIMEALRE